MFASEVPEGPATGTWSKEGTGRKVLSSGCVPGMRDMVLAIVEEGVGSGGDSSKEGVGAGAASGCQCTARREGRRTYLGEHGPGEILRRE
jgi:hypothetical protein